MLETKSLSIQSQQLEKLQLKDAHNLLEYLKYQDYF